jgi:hypothetical protein
VAGLLEVASPKNVCRARSLTIILALVALCLAAAALRWPLVTANDRFFRDEDDAHHFNRVVEMVKRRDFNPHYFNKPTLHLYLRMPVVAAGYLRAKSLGEISAISELRTRDPFGISGYAFTASHPTVLRWNRGFSILLSVGVVALAFLITLQLGMGLNYAILAGTITTLSPEVVKNSHLIAVDTLMALLCLLASSLGIYAFRNSAKKLLPITGVIAGLAGAAKYNALPIVSVPIVAWACKDRSRRGLALAVLALPIGFLIGCPYSLISWREFIRGVTYEAWHYSIAAHEGHTANPGLDQALFYLSWLTRDGVGILASILALLGLSSLLKERSASGVVFLSFPITYAVFMISQKTNFTRNMVVLVPYASIIASCGLATIARGIRSVVARRALAVGCALIIVIQNLLPSFAFVSSQTKPDSREEIVSWIEAERTKGVDIAIAGPLQAPPHLFSISGVDAFNPKEASSADLIQRGYDYVVTEPRLTKERERELISLIKEIPGASEERRFPDSPAIQIYQLNKDKLAESFAQTPATIDIGRSNLGERPRCYTEQEDYCWLTNKRTSMKLGGLKNDPSSAVKLSVMTPWRGQWITILSQSGVTIYEGSAPEPNTWSELSLALPIGTTELVIQLSQVHSLESRSLGKDRRRLGLAIRVVEPQA